MKGTITSPYPFCEDASLAQTNNLPLAGRLPLFWFTLSRAFYNLACHSPSLHSNILVVVIGNEVLNSFDVELALNRCGPHVGVTMVVLRGSAGFLGPYRDCFLHGDDEEGENWAVECNACAPWSETPVDGMHTYLSVDWVLHHCRRQILSLTLSSSSFPDALRNATPDEFPMLKELNVCKPSNSQLTPDAIFETGLWQVPTLRHVRFEGVRAPGRSGIASAGHTWGQLSSLHLSESVETSGTVDSTPDSTLTSTTLLILEQALELRDLYVRENMGRNGAGPQRSTLTHSRLERLAVEYTSDSWTLEPASHSLFDRLAAPCLRELELFSDMTPPTLSTVSFLRSHRNLTVLRIMGLSFSHTSLVDVLKGMECLRTLAVGRSEWTDEAAGPLLEAGNHSCDGQHLCDALLMLLTGVGWAKARAGVERQLSGLFGRVLDTSLSYIEESWTQAAPAQVDICPFLQELHIHGAKCTPIGLRTFIRSRAPRMQTVVIRLWDQIDSYELWDLCEEMERYKVHLDATTVVRTEWRDFTSAITRKRKEVWGKIISLPRRVEMRMKGNSGWGQAPDQSPWGSLGDDDGWGVPLTPDGWDSE